MTERASSIAVIIVAAGSGIRLGAGGPKAFIDLAGRPILAHALYSVMGMSHPAQIIVVAPADRIEETFAIAASVGVPATVVAGAPTRQGSVEAGLAAVDSDATIVLVHDAARALTPSAQFDRVVEHVRRSAAGAVPGLPVSDTVKQIDVHGTILGTVDRSQLTAVQTPQGFPREHLVQAYASAQDEVTDDAALVAAVGHPVSVIAGDPRAFKITTAWDLNRAKQLLETSGGLRVGIGTDTHAFDPETELWLAGLSWPGEPGLAGHSDGDVVAHAITDAVLSAAGLGDTGEVFGVDDPRLEGAHGEVFLSEVRAMLTRVDLQVGNVSVQLIGNRPRFSPRRVEAQRVLSSLLGAPVTISATTTDGIGFTGRGEGLTAIATALVGRAFRD